MKNLAPIPIRANPEFIDSLNSVRLREEDIVEAIKAAVDSADSGDCHLRSMASTIRLFPTAPLKARAVIFRLQALAVMMERNELKNWMRPDGATFAETGQKAIIAAVTSHPLSLVNGDITFEKESFLRRVLESAEARGILTI